VNKEKSIAVVDKESAQRERERGKGSTVVKVTAVSKRNTTCHQPGFNLEIVSFFYQLTPARTSIRAHNDIPNLSRKTWMDDGSDDERERRVEPWG
jgi:hypothetical protein